MSLTEHMFAMVVKSPRVPAGIVAGAQDALWVSAVVPPLEHDGLVIEHPPALMLEGWSDPTAAPAANRCRMHTAELGHGAL